jgi:hypothetical protein
MNVIALRARLEEATVAIGDLTQRGVHARRVEISKNATVIEIDEPPRASWLRGALRRRIGGRREMAAPFRGCQLRWECTRAHAL